MKLHFMDGVWDTCLVFADDSGGGETKVYRVGFDVVIDAAEVLFRLIKCKSVSKHMEGGSPNGKNENQITLIKSHI